MGAVLTLLARGEVLGGTPGGVFVGGVQQDGAGGSEAPPAVGAALALRVPTLC